MGLPANRLSTFISGAGLLHNQFLIKAEEPLVFHSGLRALFPSVAAAAGRVLRSSGCGGSPSGTWMRSAEVSRPTDPDRPDSELVLSFRSQVSRFCPRLGAVAVSGR